MKRTRAPISGRRKRTRRARRARRAFRKLRQPAPPETSSTMSASPRPPRATLVRPNGSQPNYTGGLRFQFQPGSCFLGEVIAGQLASRRSGNFAVHRANRWLSDPSHDWRLSVLVPGFRFCTMQKKRFVGSIRPPSHAIPLIVLIRKEPCDIADRLAIALPLCLQLSF